MPYDEEALKKVDLKEPTFAEGYKQIRASYDDTEEFVLDPNGYLLIKVHADTQEIEAGWCKAGNILEISVIGKNPMEIYQTFLNKLPEPRISRLDHAAYLGRELQKAYVALRLGIEYVQDSELDLSSIKKI